MGGVEVGIVGDAAVFVGAGSVSVVVELGGFDIDAFDCRGGFEEGGEHVMERIHVICHVRCVYEQFLATLCAFGKIKNFGYLGAIAAFGADPREMWLVPQHAVDCSLDLRIPFFMIAKEKIPTDGGSVGIVRGDGVTALRQWVG